MTVLVFGHTGQLARELAICAPEARFLGRDEADLRDPSACARVIAEHAPTVVINAAAWTAVDAAEEHKDAAFRINAEAPAAMAQAAAGVGAVFVHISTDYVFDGSGDRPWRPDDATGPLGVYGASKREGELAIRDAGGVHAVLRTSWVFSSHGQNFVKTMLRLSETRDRLSVVADQFGGPTPAREIARACLKMAATLERDPGVSGIYHFSGAPDVSWAGFARMIFELAGRNVDVADIPTSEFPTPAARPSNSRLDCTTTHEAFGIERPDWRKGLRNVLAELGSTSMTGETGG